MPIQLPHKENAIFKRILKCYEQKQYKNGLKFCKQILSNPKFSEHGETLAMKGLTLSYLGKVDEAYEYVKRGLKNDLRSHVCWHVYGLLQRADQKYDEAIKCYRNALKWDKDNLQILRDLSLLQIQMRDTEGFRDTRYQLLKIRPGQRQSWIGYSISYYLLGDYDMAFSVMEEFRKTIPQETTSKPDIEHSEMLLYQNMILSEQGKIKESIDHLNKFESFMTDKLKVKEIRASYELQMKNYREAEKIYRDLVKRNPENHMYYGAIEKCLAAQKNLTQLEENGRLGMYLNYRKHYPKCEAPKRLPLSFTTGKVFRDLLSEYLRNNLIKGVPPLFKNLQNLYQDKCKVTTIEEVVTGFINTLTNERKFVSTDSEIQDPTVLLWTQFFLAQHYDHLRNTTKALKLINDVLEHTPTLIEGYMVKAKIYKHAGAIVEAAKWMDEGRSLDTADRFVNSKCAKYMLRANQVEKAIETCGMFTKEGTTPEDDLDSMQCMWFGIECARAHQRSMKIGEALRKCHQIEASFNEIVADQFDFHTYCMRKVTLCAYIKLLKLEDIIRNHPFYFEAAQVAIQCYVSLHDKPSSATQDGTETNKGGLSDKELKKLKSKQRRAQKKQQIEDMNNEKQEPKEKETKKSAEKFDPATLVSCEKPLSEAIKFLQPLQTLASEKIETHLMAYDIYSRIGKPLLMLQSIKRAFNCNSKDPRVHLRLVKLLAKVGKEKVGYNEVVRQVLDQELILLTKEQDATIVNNQYLVSNATSLNARIAVGKARLFLNADDKEAIKMVAELPEDSTEANLQLCMDVHDWLLSKEFTEEASQYNKLCSSRFPLADVFMEEHAYQEPPIDPPS